MASRISGPSINYGVLLKPRTTSSSALDSDPQTAFKQSTDLIAQISEYLVELENDNQSDEEASGMQETADDMATREENIKEAVKVAEVARKTAEVMTEAAAIAAVVFDAAVALAVAAGLATEAAKEEVASIIASSEVRAEQVFRATFEAELALATEWKRTGAMALEPLEGEMTIDNAHAIIMTTTANLNIEIDGGVVGLVVEMVKAITAVNLATAAGEVVAAVAVVTPAEGAMPTPWKVGAAGASLMVFTARVERAVWASQAVREREAAAEAAEAVAKAQKPETITEKIQRESKNLTNVNNFLFKNDAFEVPIFEQLSEIGRRALLRTISLQHHTVLEFLRTIDGIPAELVRPRGWNIMSTINQSLIDIVREHALDLDLFSDLDKLEEACKSNIDSVARDASLRLKNLKLRPDLFQKDSGHPSKPYQCSVCAATNRKGHEGGEEEVLDGRTDDEEREFLSFPGSLNDVPSKPIIDTGALCNIVRKGWLEEQGVSYEVIPLRFHSLGMANGTESAKCPCIKVKWRFDDRTQVWVNVEFVILDSYEYDTLLGLPFLRKTKTIHNSQGQLVFPEYNSVRAKPGAIPIYNTTSRGNIP